MLDVQHQIILKIRNLKRRSAYKPKRDRNSKFQKDTHPNRNNNIKGMQ